MPEYRTCPPTKISLRNDIRRVLNEGCIIGAVDDNESRLQYLRVLREGHNGEIR